MPHSSAKHSVKLEPVKKITPQESKLIAVKFQMPTMFNDKRLNGE
jgi:hypothetical protein